MNFLDIAPFITGGLGLVGSYISGQSRDDIADAYRRQDQADYEYAQSEADRYAAYANGQAGAAAGAHNASEAARMAAAQKAIGSLGASQKKSLKYLKPYRKAGKEVLPYHTQAYKEGVQALSLLNAYMNSPEQLAKLDQSGPMVEMGAKSIGQYLPKHMLQGSY